MKQTFNERAAAGEHLTHGVTKLIFAIAYGELTDVQKLVEEEGADINESAPSDDPASPLMHAAGFGRIDIFKYLLSKGARMDERQSDGWTVYNSIAAGTHYSDLHEYEKMFADLYTAKDRNGNTAAHIMAYRERYHSLAYLAEVHGFDLESERNSEGLNPVQVMMRSNPGRQSSSALRTLEDIADARRNGRESVWKKSAPQSTQIRRI